MFVFREEPHQKVRVFVEFQPSQQPGVQGLVKHVRPRAFFWGGKRYDVQSINLVYQRRRGARVDWCFAVSDQANTFVLAYNPDALEWILEEVQGE